MRRRFRLGVAISAAALSLTQLLSSDPALAEPAGTPHVFAMAASSYDQYTRAPTPELQSWFTGHVWRMGVFSPYFDPRTSWYSNGWVYDDSYAIYTGSPASLAHPEWILRDAAGNRLYIPSGCDGVSCPQYAGDISNPAFRRFWIEGLQAEMAHGYRGVFVDDVNMDLRVSNAHEQSVTPISPASGRAISAEEWRADMARFMREVRAALPTAEISHNVIWFAAEHAGAANASIRAELEAANYVFLERGANDAGLTGGTGPWSLNALLGYVDQVHALGRHVVLDGTAEDPRGLAYNLASYLLVSDGGDGVSGGGQTPVHWWPGWSVSLGEATGGRYAWQGLLRRDFSGGIVLVNPPGSAAVSVKLPSAMKTAEGEAVTSVTLPAASGAVLTGAPSATEAPPPPVPSPETRQPTETIVEAPGSPPTPTGSGGGPTATPPPTSSPPPPATGHQPRTFHRRRHSHPAHSARRLAPRLRTERIAGRVLHATRGTLTIRVEARTHGHWVAVAWIRATLDAAGRFAHPVRLRTGERYRVRAVYHGSRRSLPSRSRYRIVLLHAR